MSGLSLSSNQSNTQLEGKWSKRMAIDIIQSFSAVAMCCCCSVLLCKNWISVATLLFLLHFLSLSLKHVTVVVLTQLGM